VGVPDEKTGEAVKLVIVEKGSRPDMRQTCALICRANMTGYKQPKVIEFQTELPKTAGGKILRRELRDAPSDARAAPLALIGAMQEELSAVLALDGRMRDLQTAAGRQFWLGQLEWPRGGGGVVWHWQSGGGHHSHRADRTIPGSQNFVHRRGRWYWLPMSRWAMWWWAQSCFNTT
jgi:hypothetical protein